EAGSSEHPRARSETQIQTKRARMPRIIRHRARVDPSRAGAALDRRDRALGAFVAAAAGEAERGDRATAAARAEVFAAEVDGRRVAGPDSRVAPARGYAALRVGCDLARWGPAFEAARQTDGARSVGRRAGRPAQDDPLEVETLRELDRARESTFDHDRSGGRVSTKAVDRLSGAALPFGGATGAERERRQDQDQACSE